MELWEMQLKDAQYVLVGLGREWETASLADYENLAELLKEKDYFVITLLTDGAIFGSSLDPSRITAPCGNRHWFQCREACTKDIWEEREAEAGVCPYCGAPLVPNTVEAKTYIEEGYLPSWQAYTKWLTRTLNRKLLLLDLGTDFAFPGLIRWPFEKTVFYNQKAFLIRVCEEFPQLPAEGAERCWSRKEHALTWLAGREKE